MMKITASFPPWDGRTGRLWLRDIPFGLKSTRWMMTHKINIPRIQKQRHYANASDEIICFVYWGKNYYYCSPPLGLKRRIRYDVTRVSRRLCSTLTNLIVGCHEPKHSLLWIWRIEKMSCAANISSLRGLSCRIYSLLADHFCLSSVAAIEWYDRT